MLELSLDRFKNPLVWVGLVLMLIGLVVIFSSKLIDRKMFKEKRKEGKSIDLPVKISGLILSCAGALMAIFAI